MGWSCCWVQSLEKQLQSRELGLEQRKRPKLQLQCGTCDELIGAQAGSALHGHRLAGGTRLYQGSLPWHRLPHVCCNTQNWEREPGGGYVCRSLSR